MTLFSQTTQWLEYVGTRLAGAEVDEKYAASNLDRHKALSAVANRSEKTVTAAKAKAYQDPEFVAAQEEVDSTYAYRKLLESLYNATDRKCQVLSRELTRRVGRDPRDSRAARWSA